MFIIVLEILLFIACVQESSACVSKIYYLEVENKNKSS